MKPNLNATNVFKKHEEAGIHGRAIENKKNAGEKVISASRPEAEKNGKLYQVCLAQLKSSNGEVDVSKMKLLFDTLLDKEEQISTWTPNSIAQEFVNLGLGNVPGFAPSAAELTLSSVEAALRQANLSPETIAAVKQNLGDTTQSGEEVVAGNRVLQSEIESLKRQIDVLKESLQQQSHVQRSLATNATSTQTLPYESKQSQVQRSLATNTASTQTLPYDTAPQLRRPLLYTATEKVNQVHPQLNQVNQVAQVQYVQIQKIKNVKNANNVKKVNKVKKTLVLGISNPMNAVPFNQQEHRLRRPVADSVHALWIASAHFVELFDIPVSSMFPFIGALEDMIKWDDPRQLSKMSMLAGLYSGVTTVQLDQLAAEDAIALQSIHPDYAKLAARLVVSNLHKQTSDRFSVSEGIVPVLRVCNASVKFVTQANKRPGSAEILQFLQLKEPAGIEELRARDLFYALWIPDLFMKKVLAGEDWMLVCPKEAPGLSEAHGPEFEAFFVRVGTTAFDYRGLDETAKIVTKNLNRVIDITHYPVAKAKYSNMHHRPLGLGVSRLADVFIMMKVPFTSAEARVINRNIFETIYFGALEASCELAQEFGPYDSYAGSGFSKGQFQFDLWDKDGLKDRILKHGVRNSLLTMCTPTASTAQIIGLLELALWNEGMKQRIIEDRGSVQNIAEIPADVKALFKTSWEISQKVVIDHAAIAPCTLTSRRIMSMHFYAFDRGLKTGMYYLMMTPPSAPLQVTVSNNNNSASSAVAPIRKVDELAVVGADGE
ncbi:hypothetical protein BJ741DRAFT_708078 [Chytriomyces cf. hyalinus JEL632]|nr:hypothetical protein BJ741DRAFT_708078 [Chytriomyces cf. hyalinus JEL632]